jgi:hypothetical protein
MSGAGEWLIDATGSLVDAPVEELDGELADVTRGSQPLREIVSHDDTKRLGGARIRSRAPIVNGYGPSE